MNIIYSIEWRYNKSDSSQDSTIIKKEDREYLQTMDPNYLSNEVISNNLKDGYGFKYCDTLEEALDQSSVPYEKIEFYGLDAAELKAAEQYVNSQENF